MRFRSKPVTTTYVEALFDPTDSTYSAQQVDGKTGKSLGSVEVLEKAKFEELYDPMVRTPRKPKAVAK